MRQIPLLVLILAALINAPLAAADEFLAQYSRTDGFRAGVPAELHSTRDGKQLLFLRSGPHSVVRDLWVLDLASGAERVLLSAQSLLAGGAEQISDAEKARRERTRSSARGIASYQVSADGTRLLIPLSGTLFVVTLSDTAIREIRSAAGAPIDARFSPDGKTVSAVRDGDLYLHDLATGAERRVTQSDARTRFGESEFVAQEEMSRQHGYWWSPDSTQLIVQSTDTSALETMHIGDATHPERAPKQWPYPRPGMPNATVRLGLVSAADGGWREIVWDFKRFEYVAQVDWPESGLPTVLVQNRLQTEQQLLWISPESGATAPLLIETDPAWVEIDEQMPHWFDGGKRFLWTTERNGARELEIRRQDGKLVRSLTGTEMGYRSLIRLDANAGEVWVQASADPTQAHLFHIPLRGGAAKRITQEAGIHRIELALPGPIYLRESRTDQGKRTVLANDEGDLTTPLRSAAQPMPAPPNVVFTRTGGDPDFHAVMVRPRNFDAAQQYPVILHVYGGPTSRMVQRDPDRYHLAQWFADHGYIVVSIDVRGTPNRGRDWHRSVKHDLITLALNDQARGLQSLAASHPELDLSRVGIYGWSFGGYFSAMAVMRRGDLFHSAFAGAPVIDWQDYDTHYTERYLGLPAEQPEAYRVSNVLTWAEQLERPLLVLHGTADDNVYFAHSLKLAEALFKAGKRFEILPLPGFTHMVRDPLVTRRLYERILDHFDRTLRMEQAPAPLAEHAP